MTQCCSGGKKYLLAVTLGAVGGGLLVAWANPGYAPDDVGHDVEHDVPHGRRRLQPGRDVTEDDGGFGEACKSGRLVVNFQFH